jgi:hypothetical protein
MLEQQGQHLEWLLVKLDSAALLVQLTGTQVCFEYPESSSSGACGGGHGTARRAESIMRSSGTILKTLSHVEQ